MIAAALFKLHIQVDTCAYRADSNGFLGLWDLLYVGENSTLGNGDSLLAGRDELSANHRPASDVGENSTLGDGDSGEQLVQL